LPFLPQKWWLLITLDIYVNTVNKSNATNCDYYKPMYRTSSNYFRRILAVMLILGIKDKICGKTRKI